MSTDPRVTLPAFYEWADAELRASRGVTPQRAWRAGVGSMSAEISRLTAELETWKDVALTAAAGIMERDAELEEAKGESLSGKWYCENHPEHEMEHDGCNGAGILSCARIERFAHLLRMSRQEIRETERMRDDLGANLRTTLAELKEARKDAGRYKWLESRVITKGSGGKFDLPKWGVLSFSWHRIGYRDGSPFVVREVGEAIDAAMTKEKP